MKYNISVYIEIKSYISTNFPNFKWTVDFIFPYGNAKDKEFCFEVNQIKTFMSELNLFNKTQNYNTDANRCSGGISQATLMPNGKLKICNAACDSEFHFALNVYEFGLEKVWHDCGDNISKIRREKRFNNTKCKVCSLKGQCSNVDCRVLSKIYTGNSCKLNPITCLAED